MNETVWSNITDFLDRLPVLHRSFHKDIMKAMRENLEEGISRYHLEVVKTLEDYGTMHVTEIGEMLLISKPQMTRLIDELIDLGMVERQPDETDRRKININLTQKGIETGGKFRETIRGVIKTRLSHLPEKELVELSTALKKVLEVGSKA
ncbi:MAG: MarR family transcriptional regulator [Chloroflexi bacterium]|nr:MarR family transcriptional regulator [Chloroflexota bacterium]